MDSTYHALDSTSGGYKTFTASFHTKTWDVTGTYNLAIETWTQKGKRTGRSNVQNLVTGELMWMVHATSPARPAGKVVDSVNLDGVSWDLWEDRRKDAGQDWMFYTFKPRGKGMCNDKGDVVECKGRLDINAYLQFLIGKGYYKGDEWIQTMELGNEIFGACENNDGNGVATGKTIVLDFNVNAQAGNP